MFLMRHLPRPEALEPEHLPQTQWSVDHRHAPVVPRLLLIQYVLLCPVSVQLLLVVPDLRRSRVLHLVVIFRQRAFLFLPAVHSSLVQAFGNFRAVAWLQISEPRLHLSLLLAQLRAGGVDRLAKVGHDEVGSVIRMSTRSSGTCGRRRRPATCSNVHERRRVPARDAEGVDVRDFLLRGDSGHKLVGADGREMRMRHRNEGHGLIDLCLLSNMQTR